MTLIYFTLTKQNQTPKQKIMATSLKAVSFLTNNPGLVEVLLAEETVCASEGQAHASQSHDQRSLLQQHQHEKTVLFPKLRWAIINALLSE